MCEETILIVPTEKKLRRFEKGIETEKLIEICERQRETQIFVSEKDRVSLSGDGIGSTTLCVASWSASSE
jgi:hypothetical protein